MPPPTLNERVRQHLWLLFKDRRFSQTAVAERLRITPSGVSRNLRTAGRVISLDFLEAVADEAGIHVAELVAPPGAVLKQLNAEEATILRALRRWPMSVRQALAAFLAFFADEEPAAGLARSHHELFRQFGRREQEWLHGVAILLREKTLPPDLREGLVDQLTREATGAPAVPTAKKK